MFVGFTPGLSQVNQSVLNPKFGKLFKLVGGGFEGKGTEAYELTGRDIVEGYRNAGFAAIGSGGVGWFNPEAPTGLHLTQSFNAFFYPGNTYSLDKQIDWLTLQIARNTGDIFVFLNVGETHVPYYFAGAPWDPADNPCRPFQTTDRAAECKERQRLCCEFVDRRLAPLLEAFSNSTILVCADHGDCWGEDGLWEHGISHPCTLSVPLLARVRGAPVVAQEKLLTLETTAVAS
jgi:hypothetical protein